MTSARSSTDRGTLRHTLTDTEAAHAGSSLSYAHAHTLASLARDMTTQLTDNTDTLSMSLCISHTQMHHETRSRQSTHRCASLLSGSSSMNTAAGYRELTHTAARHATMTSHTVARQAAVTSDTSDATHEPNGVLHLFQLSLYKPRDVLGVADGASTTTRQCEKRQAGNEEREDGCHLQATTHG
jgi:hypothetical protein